MSVMILKIRAVFRWNLSQILVLLSGYVFLATEDTSSGEALGIQILLFGLFFILGLITLLALMCPPMLAKIFGVKSNDQPLTSHDEGHRDLLNFQMTAPTATNQVLK
jgi:hypothetical protein